jgi:hypothetical protein
MLVRLAVLLAAAVCVSCGLYTPSADDLRNHPHGHLVWAARAGDVAAIGRLAASGVDLDDSSATPLLFVFPDFDHTRATALQHAVRKHKVDAVRVLLEWGAQPDALHDGAPPLLIAADSDDPAIVRLLLDAGADIETTRRWLAQEEPGGPLWHVIEHVVGWASGHPRRKDVLERMRAIPAPSRP